MTYRVILKVDSEVIAMDLIDSDKDAKDWALRNLAENDVMRCTDDIVVEVSRLEITLNIEPSTIPYID